MPPEEPQLTLDERKFEQDKAARKRELDLKEREITAREREVTNSERDVALREIELKRTRWGNPLVLALFAAAIGLIGNIFVARVNNTSTQDLERIRAQSNLILEAIKTGNPDAACKNLLFFVNLGLVRDQDKAIHGQCDSAPIGPPSLPAFAPPPTMSVMSWDFDNSPDAEARGYVQDMYSGTGLSGAEVTLGSGARAEKIVTDAQGFFVFKKRKDLQSSPIFVSKPGYIPFDSSLPSGVGNIKVSLVPITRPPR